MTFSAYIIGLASLGTAAALLIWPDQLSDNAVERMERERQAEEAAMWLRWIELGEVG